ncbi:MAG: hypothetical protein WD598_09905 [Acidimicrobiia bacterium]
MIFADDQFKWFYWLSFFLAGGFLLMVLSLCVGYVRKIMLPKYRGRRVE